MDLIEKDIEEFKWKIEEIEKEIEKYEDVEEEELKRVILKEMAEATNQRERQKLKQEYQNIFEKER